MNSSDAYKYYRQLLDEQYPAQEPEPKPEPEPEPMPRFAIATGPEILTWYASREKGVRFNFANSNVGTVFIYDRPWIMEDPRRIFLLPPGWGLLLNKAVNLRIGSGLADTPNGVAEVIWDWLQEYKVG